MTKLQDIFRWDMIIEHLGSWEELYKYTAPGVLYLERKVKQWEYNLYYVIWSWNSLTMNVFHIDEDTTLRFAWVNTYCYNMQL